MSTAVAVKKEHKSIPGVMTCQLDLHIEKATADYRWTGPKISQQLWFEILAFFEWTQAECKSESQVRLFVNSVTNEWGAWAFPQKANTGMSSNELPDHANWAAGAAKFAADLGWWYYGTVHHHCSAGAFQSGTDEQNEMTIDGLHFTVGKIGSPHYDLDYRLYQSKWKLKMPDLADFWDIGNAARAIIPVELYGTVAKHQMSVPPPKDFAFPTEWKENYITPPVIITPTYTPTGRGTVTPHWSDDHMGFANTERRLFINDRQRLPSDITYDAKQAATQVLLWCAEAENAAYSPEEMLQLLEQLVEDRGLVELCRLMWLHDLSPGAFAQELDQRVAEELLKEELKEANENQKDAQAELDKLAGEGSHLNGYGMTNHMD